MAVILRQGLFGSYYGNTYETSNALTFVQMELNARYIYTALLSHGFTKNAIAGMLGNMEVESSLNPGRWQNDRVGGSTEGHGYGLVQWTPYTKYTEWATSNGYSDPSSMDANISRIIYEIENNIQWIGVGTYSDMSFDDFRKSNLSAGELAKAFVLCYERPLDQSESHLNYRASLGEKWFEFLGGTYPNPPVVPTVKKRHKFNFILFNARKRKIYG